MLVIGLHEVINVVGGSRGESAQVGASNPKATAINATVLFCLTRKAPEHL